MVKGTPNIRSFFQSKKDIDTSPARPPLSSRNNPSAANCPPARPSATLLAKPDGRSTQAKSIRGQVSYPHLENVDSNVGSSSSNTSSPEKFSTPCGTPLKTKPKRTQSVANRLPSSSSDVDSGPSSRGGYGEYLSRTSSNVSSLATSSDEEATITGGSAPSSTSGSDAENVSLPRQQSARRQEGGLRRVSLGPKIEAAVTKLEKTPTKPSRPGRITPCASPLRSGVQRALVLQQPSAKNHCEVQSNFELQENPSFWDDHNVQVVIRTRPISNKEVAKQDCSRCFRQEGPYAITWLGQPETRFTFDHVAGENISQEKLFKVVGLPIVENCMAGYNSCMFAYGQTGSGKTHTMLGDITDLGDRPNDNRGMTPRIFEYLFSRIQKEEQDRQLEQLRYVCKCSFLEIYNEQITDLLEPSSSNLQMREDSKKGVYVENLTEKVVTSVQDVVLLLLKGAANRKVASTNMNRESSRSHSVFTCSIESKWETNSLSNMRFGRLNLVDLAGSERQKSSGAEGDRLKEAASINKSLSTLGLVIMILVDIANGKQRHVPYRDSKLTFLLQDSLGGNSKTAIIATISPSTCCSSETLSTLKFAQRAKFIQNNAVINEDASGEMLALRREIQQLKEEVSRLRCQSLTSMRRECRRESNEFFRLSMSGKDLFDAAGKEFTDEGADLKSVELLEKIKALEAVLAGALRREQVADISTKQMSLEMEKANKLIEERETEVRNCKNLLHLHADESALLQSSEDIESSSDSMLAKKLEIADRLEQNSVITKLDLENIRLTEQLHSHHTFFDAGEREMMSAEIQGLRDQVLELLDGKIAVERGSLSATIAQGDSYRKELETCRNDLTNCLEASSQLQRQVDELQTLVNQLTEDRTDKDKELDRMKESYDKSVSLINQLETERALHLEEITDLKSRLQVGQEEAKINANISTQLEQDLHYSVEEVGRLRAEIQESTEKNVNMAKLKEEEIETLQTKWETATAKLYHDLAEGERALTEVGQEMDEIMAEDWLVKSMQEKATRWSLGSSKSQKEVDTEHDYFKRRDSCNSDEIFGEKRSSRRKRSFGISIMTEEKLKLEASVARLEQELEEHKQRLHKEEHIQKELERVEKFKLGLQEEMEILAKTSVNTLEENVDLKVEVQQLRIKFLEQNEATELLVAHKAALEQNLADLEKVKLDQAEALALKSQEALDIQEENLRLRNEIARIAHELKDIRERAEKTQRTLESMAQVHNELTEESAQLKLQADQNSVLQTCLNTKISRLEITMQADKETIQVLEEAKQELDSEVKLKSQKLASNNVVEKELRKTVSSLHVEIENKIQKIEELDLQAMSKAESYAEELKLKAAYIESGQMRICELEAQLKDLQEELSLKSQELETLTTESSTQSVNFRVKSQTLSQELEHERAALVALQREILLLTTSLQQNQDELRGFKINEASLVAELLSLKKELSRSECNVDVTREAETRLQEELLAMTQFVKDTILEEDCLKEELAAAQALVLKHQSTITTAQQKIEADVQTITRLNETVEQLQTELQRKEDLLYGLEFDIRLLQEHAAEDTDFKQELLKANSRIYELQGEVQTRYEELKELDCAKKDVEEQLAIKAAAMKQLEDELLNSGEHIALVTNERQGLNLRISILQTRVSALEAEVAEKTEALSTLEKELMVTRVTSTRMTTECSHKTEALQSLQGEVQTVSTERDDLKAQCSILVQQVDSLEANIAQQVAKMDALHGELLVSKTKAAKLEAKEAAYVAELDQTNENIKQLNVMLSRTSETANQLGQEKVSMENHITELEVEMVCLKSQLAQRTEFEDSLQGKIITVLESADRSLAEEENLKSRFEDLQGLNCKLERDLAEKVDALISLENEVMATKSRTAQSLEENVDLRATISALQKNLDDMNHRIATLVIEKDTLEDILLQKDGALTSMSVELTAAKESMSCVELLRSKLGELELQKGAVEDELQIARENQIVLQDKIQGLTQRLADSQESNKSLNLQLAENTTEMNSLQVELSIASGSSTEDHQKHQTMKAEIGALLKERDALQTEVGEKSETGSYLESELLLARASAESSRENFAAMETKLGALQAERDNTHMQITELKRGVISALESELTEAKKSVKFLENEMAEARRVADCVSDENSALQAQIVGLQAEKGTLEVELSCKTGLIMSLEAELAAASSSSTAVRDSFEAHILELQTVKLALETEIAEMRASISTIMSCKKQENNELLMQIEIWQHKCCAREVQLDEASQEMDTMKAQIIQQEEQLSSLEELLDRAEAEALQLMVNTKPNHAMEECDSLRSEVESLKGLLCTKVAELEEQENGFKDLERRLLLEENKSEEIKTLKDESDKALGEVQALNDELRRVQSLVVAHKASALEAQKFAEVNILRASAKEEEAKILQESVSTLKNQNRALDKQLEVTKLEADKLRKTRDEFEMELQGMKNRMSMIQAVHSTGSRNVKGFQAAQAASLDLQRRLEEKETEVSQMYKKMNALQSQNEVQASRLEEMETELTHVHQELDELHSQCDDKDAQLSALKVLNKEAETLTQDVMRDLHNVKLDIGNYASLVSQQQLELISERTRHADEAREKDEELSNLHTQLNQERQNWMLEMNHKQAEIVVSRVLAEKTRLKNKTLSAEYKKLKADCAGKKKKLKLLEQQLTKLTTETGRFSMGAESEADFDEVQQFQALLAQANDTHGISVDKESEADFDEVQQFQALLAQANDHGLAQRQ